MPFVFGDMTSYNEGDRLEFRSGQWVAVAQPTVSFMIPMAEDVTAEAIGFSTWLLALLNAGGQNCSCSFAVPSDFKSLVGVYIVFFVATTGTIDWTVNTRFAADGEPNNTHTDTATQDGLAVTDAQIKVLDISAAFTGLAAGDFAGCNFIVDVLTGTSSVSVLGLLFKYKN